MGGEEGVQVGGGFARVGVVEQRKERRMRRKKLIILVFLPPFSLLLEGSLNCCYICR